MAYQTSLLTAAAVVAFILFVVVVGAKSFRLFSLLVLSMTIALTAAVASAVDAKSG